MGSGLKKKGSRDRNVWQSLDLRRKARQGYDLESK